MTVREMAAIIDAETICGEDLLDRTVEFDHDSSARDSNIDSP